MFLLTGLIFVLFLFSANHSAALIMFVQYLTLSDAQPQDVMALATSLVTTPHTEGMA